MKTKCTVAAATQVALISTPLRSETGLVAHLRDVMPPPSHRQSSEKIRKERNELADRYLRSAELAWCKQAVHEQQALLCRPPPHCSRGGAGCTRRRSSAGHHRDSSTGMATPRGRRLRSRRMSLRCDSLRRPRIDAGLRLHRARTQVRSARFRTADWTSTSE